MLLVAGLVVVVAVVGAVVLGVLLLGLWRRARGLLGDLGELGDRLERARDAVGQSARDPHRVPHPHHDPDRDHDLGQTLGGHPESARTRAPGHLRP